MPTNLYTDWFHQINEQRLYEDLINETVQFYGIDTYYMPRTSESSPDLLFGEDPTSKFTEAFPVEVYVQSVDEFEGGELFSKFGLEVKKQARFLITNRSFAKNVPDIYKRPREGDLLWMSSFKALFEIKYVDEEHFFYTFGNTKIYGFSLVAEKFRYSNERITTDRPEIDAAMNSVVPSQNLYMSSVITVGGVYAPGETVYQGPHASNTTATGIVTAWDRPSLSLTVKHVNGSFIVNQPVVGMSSLTEYVLSSTVPLQDVNMALDDNTRVQSEANAVLDFSETNPFGDP